MGKIAAVVFDWGGVLIDNPAPALEAYCARYLGVPCTVFRREFRRFARGFQTGSLAEAALWKMLCSRLRVRRPQTPSLWYEAFAAVYAEKREVFRIAESLRRTGYRIGLLSNTEQPAVRFFNEQNYRVFDATAFSCVLGAAKPDPAVYHWVAGRLGVSPSECVFIDDTTTYAAAARRVGMHGIAFGGARRLAAELRDAGVRIGKTRITSDVPGLPRILQQRR